MRTSGSFRQPIAPDADRTLRRDEIARLRAAHTSAAPAQRFPAPTAPGHPATAAAPGRGPAAPRGENRATPHPHTAPVEADAVIADDDPDGVTPLLQVASHGITALGLSLVALFATGMIFWANTAATTESVDQRAAGTGLPDTSQALPVEAVRPSVGALGDEPDPNPEDETTNGELEVFDRSAEASVSDPVRRELDRAIAGRRAHHRDAQLSRTNDRAVATSDERVVDARGRRLVDTQEATKRENARLEEEKRKAEQALAEQRRAEEQSRRDAAQQRRGPLLPPRPEELAGDRADIDGNAATPVAAGGYSVSARWGAVGSWSRYHTGVDLAAPVGTPLRAAADGVVIPANGGGWAGTHVVIRHSDGSATLYAHMSGASVSPGQTVKAGQPIGAVGMTGRTFGPHLHFEHYPNASTVGDPYTTDDPARWLMGLGVNL